jgi:foldase protein PrsA
MRRLAALVLALFALVAALPAAADVPPRTVATVDGTRIGRSTFDHWLRAAARGERPRSPVPRPGTRRWRVLSAQVMEFLIGGRWIALEARERGIRVSRRMVRRTFERQRRESFPSEREYRRWLRSSGQTERDLLFRVRLDMLSDRVRRHALRGIEDPEEQQRRLEEFVADFRAKWRARTECAPRFLVPECGNAPAT